MIGGMEWEIDTILWFQSFSPFFDPLFKAVSFTGDEWFYLLFLPFMIWCVDRQVGFRLTLLFLVNSYLNIFGRTIFSQPRPFLLDDRILALVESTGNGFPSGHTQNAVAVWGYLAYCLNHRLRWGLAGFMVIMVPVSQIYLGVNLPTDLFAGFLVGCLVLFGFIKLEPPAINWYKESSLSAKIAASLAIPALLVMIIPMADNTTIAIGAVLIGSCLGLALERLWIGYEIPVGWKQKLLCYAAGTGLLLILYLGLNQIMAEWEPAPCAVSSGMVSWGPTSPCSPLGFLSG